MNEDGWSDRAARLLGELMPVSVAVAGEGAEAVADSLRQAGADAEACQDGCRADGQDLALLLAAPGSADEPATRERVERLTAATDRILFVPVRGGDLVAVTAWFELFAERGFQPVLEYDAGFLGQGAFLVDRNAVAAETELAEFADRLAPETAPAPAPAPPPVSAAAETELAALRRRLAEREAALAETEAALEQARAQLEAWAPLRRWVDARVRAATAKAPRWPFRIEARRRAADEAAIRRSDLFDPAWYIASHPDLAEKGGDPVAHYWQEGTADPGPWFDTAAYLRDHPELDPAATNPLLHAIRNRR